MKLILFTMFICCFVPLQGAAQKNIYGVVSVRTSFSSIAKENRGAVDELFQCVTGTESKEDTPTLLAQIATETGLPVKEGDVLVSLHIDDAPEVEVAYKSPHGWHKGYMCCSQLTDADGKQARVAGMWPVHWFMHKKEGDVVTLPLWGGAFLAHLTVGPASEKQSLPFCKLLALNAGLELASKSINEDPEIYASQALINMLYQQQFFVYARSGSTLEGSIGEARKEINKRKNQHAWQAAEEHYGISENN